MEYNSHEHEEVAYKRIPTSPLGGCNMYNNPLHVCNSNIIILLLLLSLLLLLLLLLLEEVGSARLRESDIHPISPKTPAPQCQPIDRKKRKGKIVENYSWDRAA